MDVLEQFHAACQNVVNNAEEPALNYCVNYAKAGLEMHTQKYISWQVHYVEGNMEHWHGTVADETKVMLKYVASHLSELE